MKVTISCHLVRFQNENVNNILAGPIMYNITALRYQRQTSFQLKKKTTLSLRPFNQFSSKSFCQLRQSITIIRIELRFLLRQYFPPLTL